MFSSNTLSRNPVPKLSSVPSDSQMEHQDDSSLRTQHRVQFEMMVASEENRSPPLPLQPSCNHLCAFAEKEYQDSASDQLSKSAVKLCGLIVFCVIFMVIEVVGGIKANSLAILTDAAHLLGDAAGFTISLFAVWASSWAATSHKSFGFNRLEVLGALASVQLIWLVCGLLIYEAFDRILHKHVSVNGKLMFSIAALGFIINLIMVIWLNHGHHGHGHGHSHHGHGHGQVHHACKDKDHHCEREELCERNEEENTHLVSRPQERRTEGLNINLQGANLHIITDLIQSVGVMIAGSIIWAKPDWLVVDLVCTLIFSVLALATTLPMIKDIFCILMESTPSKTDIADLENGLRCIKGVRNVHDLHVWAITHGKTVMACHVIAEPEVNSDVILPKIKDYCERTHGIHHLTIQIE